MARNQSEQTKEKALINEIRDIRKELEAIKTNQLYFLNIPLLAADPTGPELFSTRIWVNTTENRIKVRVGGTTKYVNLT